MTGKPQVKVYRAPNARMPSHSTPGSAALDVRACLEPDTVCCIPPGKRMAIPTGLQFEIPEGYCISIRPRSGLALKSGLILPNSPGTIDSDYRGELKILVANIDLDNDIEIKHGDRIAQLLLEKVEEFVWAEVSESTMDTNTQRGTGGFGSTGLA